MEQFNKDEGLVLAAKKRELVKIQHYQEEQRIRKESLEEGKLASKKEFTLMLFKSKFPEENYELLNDLTLDKYNAVFKALIENKDLNTIKEIAQKTR